MSTKKRRVIGGVVGAVLTMLVGEFLPLGAANLKEASALCSGTTGKTRRGHSVFLWAVRNWTKFGSYLIDMIR